MKKGMYVDGCCNLRKQKLDKPRRFYVVKTLQYNYGGRIWIAKYRGDTFSEIFRKYVDNIP
jgi:hypothetical protein